jgi:putative hydrolase of the HAD superfamily
MTGQVRGVLVDLDDTLYPQAQFLELAWSAVARRGGELGLDPELLLTELRAVAAAGSARGGIIDEAVRRVGGAVDVRELVATFHAVRPERLTPFPGVLDALAELRARVPVGLITDGAVAGQQAKLDALGLADAFDTIVFSDVFGRSYRKPHPRPFQVGLGCLGLGAPDAVLIGDRPDTDITGAAAIGLRAIRVRTGEYASRPDHPGTWRHVASFAAAADLLSARLLHHGLVPA